MKSPTKCHLYGFSLAANDGQTLNAGLVALWFFRGSGPARKPYIFVIFQGGGGWTPCPPLPLDQRMIQLYTVCQFTCLFKNSSLKAQRDTILVSYVTVCGCQSIRTNLLECVLFPGAIIIRLSYVKCDHLLVVTMSHSLLEIIIICIMNNLTAYISCMCIGPDKEILFA